MYDGKTQLLIKNPIDRYLINSPMLPSLKKNADGSLTLYIQKDLPGKDKELNWLPAPDGPIYMAMRLYCRRPKPRRSCRSVKAHGSLPAFSGFNRGGRRIDRGPLRDFVVKAIRMPCTVGADTTYRIIAFYGA